MYNSVSCKGMIHGFVTSMKLISVMAYKPGEVDLAFNQLLHKITPINCLLRLYSTSADGLYCMHSYICS